MATNKEARSKKDKDGGGAIQKAGAVFDLSRPDFNLPFFHYLTIPKNTTKENPFTYDMSLPIGMINRLWVEFPRGCAGFAAVRIIRGVTQIFPLPEGVYLRSDNSVMNFAFSHVINSEPNIVTLEGINTDDTYSHTIWVCFEMSGIIKTMSKDMESFIKLLGG